MYENPFLTEEKRIRFATILRETLEFIYAAHLEITKKDAAKEYLKEKMSAINRDIECLNSILEDEEE